MQWEKLLVDVRVKTSVKHNDKRVEQRMRGAKTSEGDVDGGLEKGESAIGNNSGAGCEWT